MNLNNFSAAIKSGVPSLCWAFSAMLAILVAALIGYALAFPVFYGLSAIKTIHPYAQSLAELVFTLGTTGTPLIFCWFYFSGRLRFVTGWIERLPSVFHLDHYLPGFPAVFAFNPRSVGASPKTILLWALAGVIVVYCFDYLTGDLLLSSESHSAEHALSHISGVNFFVSTMTVAFLASFLEEVLFRGFVLNIWQTAFATDALKLEKSTDRAGKFAHRVLLCGGAFLSLIISAALFAIAHLEGLLSQFFFGLVAGFIYLQTRTLWSSIAMHVINNAILPVMLLVGYLNGAPAAAPALFVPPAAGTVGFVSQSEIDREDFNKGGNIFMQVCQPSDCTKELEMLKGLASKFPEVVFYQAQSSKVPALKERLEKEAGAGTKELYPVYIYASDAMHIAPPEAKGQDELENFIQQLSGGSSKPMETFNSQWCDVGNKGAFDGAKLYKCAFDQTVNTDLALLDKNLREAFIARHKDKESLLARDDESAAVKAINLMFSDLNEMHSSFFTREEFAAEQDKLENKLVEIGVSFKIVNEENPLVVYPDPDQDTPAWQAGFRSGDRIVTVDGIRSSRSNIPDTLKQISGKAGTQVNIGILRVTDGREEMLNINVLREITRTKEVKLTVLPEGYAAVKVRIFGNSVSEAFSQALYQACTGSKLPADEKSLQELTNSYIPEKDCGLKGLIIDLRNNPGGRLDKVTEMMQAIITKGPLVTVHSRKGEVLEEIKESVNATTLQRRVFAGDTLKTTKDFPRFWKILPDGLPIVVLINEGSASASEILAGSLQANKLATVVGRPSFGKEVGQTITPVDFGFALRITTFKFLPGDKEMDGAIIPDFLVEGDEQFMPKAVSVLKMGAEALFSLEKEEAQTAKANLRNKTKQEHSRRDAKIHAARAAFN